MTEKYDVIVVGSGVGASPAAAKLAAAGAKVCVLERGAWRGKFINKLPYPETRIQANLDVRNVNSFQVKKDGLMEFNFYGTYLCEMTSGVGGGSLVIGGFLDKPPRDMWDRYPPEITREVMERHYDNVARVVKPAVPPVDTPYSQWISEACKQIPGVTVLDAESSISFGSGPYVEESWTNEYGITQKNCNYCGLCMYGCNRGAKNSMDINYLQVVLQNDGRIKDLCEVECLRTADQGYIADYIDHKTGAHESVAAPRMILAAGAFNTMKILFRSRKGGADGLINISGALGTRYGSNGDRVGFGFTPNKYLDHGYGTCLFKKMEIASDDPDKEWDYHMFACRMGILGKPAWSPLSWSLNHLMPFLSLTREEPIGRLYEDEKGKLKLDYPHQECHRKADIMQQRIAYEVDCLNRDIDPAEKTQKIKKIESRKAHRGVGTVHPQGGAPIGQSAADAVVDFKGEVFNYPGLYISDGSILPCATACGPHYTIAALGDYIAEGIVAHEKG